MILPKVCFFGYLNAIILRDYSAGNPNSKTNDILCPKQIWRKFGEISSLNGQTQLVFLTNGKIRISKW